MIIEYDEETREILIDDESVSFERAMEMIKELDKVTDRWLNDHDVPDGHNDDF